MLMDTNGHTFLSEDYVSYEVAKLLKEKGFNERSAASYDPKGQLQEGRAYWNKTPIWYAAPTHQMAMKWLREVYHIEMYITFGFPFIDDKQQYKYFWSIVKVCDNHLEYPMDDPGSASYNEEMADSYEEAVEATLKYSLENLI